MAHPSISVVIPHHNRPDLVGRTIESILSQTFQPMEILLVDDSSRPEDREKINAFAGSVTILDTPKNLGLAGTRNYGAQAAKGDWLAFLDDDDCWVPDKLERQVKYLESHPRVDALGGGLTMVTPDGREEYWGRKPTRKLDLPYALCYTASMAQALLIRRDVFQDLGGFDPSLRYLEDYEFGIRLLASGNETHYIAESLFIYYRGGRQQLSLQWEKMFKAELHILKMHEDLVRQQFGSLGPMRLRARCFRKHGLWKGGLAGRSVWAWGCAVGALLGGNWQDPTPVAQG